MKEYARPGSIAELGGKRIGNEIKDKNSFYTHTSIHVQTHVQALVSCQFTATIFIHVDICLLYSIKSVREKKI